MKPSTELAVAILTTALSGVLYGLAFPPHPHPLLSWWALVPLLIVLRRERAPRAAALGWWWTFVMTCTVNDWFPGVVAGFFGQGLVVGAALFLAVTTFTAGIQYAGFGAWYSGIERDPVAARPWLAAAAWVAADLARLWLFGGDPWALAGYSQTSLPAVVQVADLAGVHGVTFLLVAANAAIAEVLAAAARRDGSVRTALLRTGPVVFAAVLAALAYGGLRLRDFGPDASAPGATRVPVGIAQAHLPLGSMWKEELYGRNLSAYLELTDRLGKSSAPRLVVWPEASMTFFLADEPAYRASIARVLGATGADLIAGGPFAPPGADGTYYNSAFLLSPAGQVLARYDKRVLLPFAERFPLGGWVDLLRRSFGRVREFTPGDWKPPFPVAGANVGVLICNEGFFPEGASERVRDGATLLVHLSNDSWLGEAKYSEPAFDMVRFRAIEQRRWIVRASTSGPSAIVAPTGEVVERSALLSRATLAGQVGTRSGRTAYHVVGDAFAWACAAVAALAAWKRRRPRDGGDV